MKGTVPIVGWFIRRGKTPELAFADYIDGAKEYFEVAADYR